MAVEASAGDLERFRGSDGGSPFVLVQLLRLAEGGRELYLKYSTLAQPIVRFFGGQVLYAGECVAPLVAAPGGGWDAVVLVRYPNRSAYVRMQADPAYRAILHLRQAALREAVLLPMDDWPGR
jgi:uncharacterized protein (DUF1330 family)